MRRPVVWLLVAGLALAWLARELSEQPVAVTPARVAAGAFPAAPVRAAPVTPAPGPAVSGDTVPIAGVPPSQPGLSAPELPADPPAVGGRWFGFCPAAGEAAAPTRRPHGISVPVADDVAVPLRRAFADLHAADARDDPAAAIEALRRAERLVPGDPALALALGRRLASTPELAEARRALRVYLATQPDDREVSRLDARLGTALEIQEGYTRRDRRGLTVLSPPDVDGDAILALVDASLDEASRLLGAPRRNALTVVVYPGRAELLAVSCVPPWSIGLFDGTLRLVADVMTTPEARSRLVRHETLHSALAAAAPRSPTWLHEGLAQYFAGEVTAGHRHSYRLMVRDRTYIPFTSLEGSFLGFDTGDDAGLAYHQSRAMIDALVERRGERVIADAVEYLRGTAPTAGLLGAIGGGLGGDDLLDYLARHATRL